MQQIFIVTLIGTLVTFFAMLGMVLEIGTHPFISIFSFAIRIFVIMCIIDSLLCFSKFSLIVIAVVSLWSIPFVPLFVIKRDMKESIFIILFALILIVDAVLIFSAVSWGKEHGAISEDSELETFFRTYTKVYEKELTAIDVNTKEGVDIYCFYDDGFYAVMQKEENGGYKKEEYPCDSTKLFETSETPCLKIIKKYKEEIYILENENELFAPIHLDAEIGENVVDIIYSPLEFEIYVPNGTLKRTLR